MPLSLEELNKNLARAKKVNNLVLEKEGITPGAPARATAPVRESYAGDDNEDDKPIPDLQYQRKSKPSPQHQQIMEEDEEINFELSGAKSMPDVSESQIMGLLTGRNIRDLRMENKEYGDEPPMVIENKKPKSNGQRTMNGLTMEEILDAVREVIREEIDNYIDQRLVTESVAIKVGSTVFSGNLKAVPAKKKI